MLNKGREDEKEALKWQLEEGRGLERLEESQWWLRELLVYKWEKGGESEMRERDNGRTNEVKRNEYGGIGPLSFVEKFLGITNISTLDYSKPRMKMRENEGLRWVGSSWILKEKC